MPRKKKTVEQHKMTGTFQPCRHGKKKAVKLPIDRPTPPEHLTEREKDYFNQVADQLQELGILCLADKFILELIACTLEEHYQLNEFIKANGRTYENEMMSGAITVKAYPQVAMLQDCGKRLTSLFKELGLTSQSREKLPIEPEKKGGKLRAIMNADPFDEYMKAVISPNKFEGF